METEDLSCELQSCKNTALIEFYVFDVRLLYHDAGLPSLALREINS